MLDATIIMYSRSLTKDYRWIYSSDLVDEIKKRLIFNDYSEFEKNKGFFLKEDYLIVRQFYEGIAVYKFVETKDKDQNSRKIYALLGCLFSEIDFDIVRSMFKYVISYINDEFNVLFEKYQSNIPEKKDYLVECIQFSLDTITEKAKNGKNYTHLISNISSFINQYPTKNLIIKNNSDLILWENQLPEESTHRIEDSIKKVAGTVETSPATMRKEKSISESGNKNALKKVPENQNVSSNNFQQRMSSNDMEKTTENAGDGNSLQRKGVEQRSNLSTPHKNIDIIAGNPNAIYPGTQYRIPKESKENINVLREAEDKLQDDENTKEKIPKLLKWAVNKISGN